MKYKIRVNDKKEAVYLIGKIRKLIKVRRTMEANQNLTKLNDIFMNIKEVKPNESDQ